MAVRIGKSQALALFCHARQAERSLDFALHASQQWAKLLEYYNQKRQRLDESLAALQRAAPSHLPIVRRASLQRIGAFGFMSLPFRLAFNRLRSHWTIRVRELSFLIASFAALKNVLEEEVPPSTDRLIELRTDLQTCQDILRRRLIGVPELKRASRIEHFCQAGHVRSVTLEELGVA